MSRFIQIHMLTAYPPANLNRDDLGRPKTARMGGVDRLRVSSQSLKRAWRTSDMFQQAMAGHIGTRTKEMGKKIYKAFIETGVKHKNALEWSKAIAGHFGKLKTLSRKDKEQLSTIPEQERLEQGLVELEIEQLAHFCPAEQKNIWQLVEKASGEGKAPDKQDLELLRSKTKAVDIALFGRMLASAPAYNIEAACQVAHAISVHQVAVEDDYFTAVDDLNEGRDDLGAAHIGETGFAAGLFYAYICLNRELLIDNLNGDVPLAQRAVRALTEAAVKVPPNGKQNSFASRAYASYVLAEKGDQQPRSLSAAFLKPVTDRDGEDFALAAIEALDRQQKNMDLVYGACADQRCDINVPAGKGTLQKLLDFIAE